MSLQVNNMRSPAARVSWYVASTQPRRELVAKQNLESQHFGTFLPQMHATNKKARGDMRLVPLFPGYIFVSFRPGQDRWRAINSTFGVRGLVGGHSSGPAQVPEAIMHELFHRCPNHVWREDAAAAFINGQEVSLIEGPFAGRTARFEQLLPQDRVRVLLDCLQTAVNLTLPRSSIAA